MFKNHVLVHVARLLNNYKGPRKRKNLSPQECEPMREQMSRWGRAAWLVRSQQTHGGKQKQTHTTIIHFSIKYGQSCVIFVSRVTGKNNKWYNSAPSAEHRAPSNAAQVSCWLPVHLQQSRTRLFDQFHCQMWMQGWRSRFLAKVSSVTPLLWHIMHLSSPATIADRGKHANKTYVEPF